MNSAKTSGGGLFFSNFTSYAPPGYAMSYFTFSSVFIDNSRCSIEHETSHCDMFCDEISTKYGYCSVFTEMDLSDCYIGLWLAKSKACNDFSAYCPGDGVKSIRPGPYCICDSGYFPSSTEITVHDPNQAACSPLWWKVKFLGLEGWMWCILSGSVAFIILLVVALVCFSKHVNKQHNYQPLSKLDLDAQ